MEAKAKLFGHPIHQMLIVFPLGLLATSFFFDIGWLAIHRAGLGVAAYYMIAAGVIGGLVAAVFGLIDWLGIPSRTRAKAIGVWHGGGDVVGTGPVIVTWFLRRGTSAPRTTAHV